MLNGLSHFWINRRCDTERCQLIEAYFSAGLVKHVRIEATTPETLPRITVRQPFLNSLAELAILTSHLDAIGQAYREGHEYAVILEDDVRSRYLFDTKALIASAPADWEILQLHVSNKNIVPRLGLAYLQHNVLWNEWERQFFSAGAYLISRRGAERLLARYRPSGREIDLTSVHAPRKVVADNVLFRRMNCYSTTVPYFFNHAVLASTHAPHRDDTQHRPGAQVVEQVMHHIEQRWMAHGKTRPQAPYPFAIRSIALAAPSGSRSNPMQGDASG